MRRIATLTLVLGLTAFAAVAAEDKAAIEAEALAHLQAGNTELEAALNAMTAGDYATGCPHLRKAGEESKITLNLFDRYRQAVLDDTALTPADRDADLAEVAALRQELQSLSDGIDQQLQQRCS